MEKYKLGDYVLGFDISKSPFAGWITQVGDEVYGEYSYHIKIDKGALNILSSTSYSKGIVFHTEIVTVVPSALEVG